jgi:hypothetical protein
MRHRSRNGLAGIGVTAKQPISSTGELVAPPVVWTWAQVRAGGAMAHLMLNSLDGAAAQIAPVLELASEMRIDTVTGYLRTLDQMLSQPRSALDHPRDETAAGHTPGGMSGYSWWWGSRQRRGDYGPVD